MRRPAKDGVDAVHTHGLAELSGAVRYRQYLIELMASYCQGSVLEVGAGHGDFIALLDGGRRLVATDADPECIKVLEERFGGDPHVEVASLDVTKDIWVDPPVDTLVAINVLEHIEDDGEALRRMTRGVRRGGTVVLFVPGYPSLYGAFDRAVGHCRRYTPEGLRRVVGGAGLEIDVLRPVNFLGGIVWWLAVRLGKQTRPRPFLVRIYDRLLIPVVRLMERHLQLPFGQSILCVAHVTNA